MKENLDELIREYSQKLMELSPSPQPETESKNDDTPSVSTEKASPLLPIAEEDNLQKDDKNEPAGTNKAPDTGLSSEKDSGEEASDFSRTKRPIPVNPENFATFRARVFSGNSAFAVENAKVSVHMGDELYAFLVTDKNGETLTVKLETFPEENSLEPLSEDQTLDYAADVSAEGFINQTNLPVSAVGGSDIVLNVSLVPESEGEA